MKRTSSTRKTFPIYFGKHARFNRHKPNFKCHGTNGAVAPVAFTLVVFCALLAITALYLKAPFQAYYLAHFKSFQLCISLLTIGSLTGLLFGQVTEGDWKGGLQLGLAVSGIVCAFAIALL